MITSLTTRPWHEVPHPIFPQKPPGSVITFRCLITPPMKKFFLISNLNLPWHSLKLCSLVLSQIAWEKRLNPPPAPTSFQTSLVPAVLLSGWHDVKFLVSCLEGTKGLALLTPQTQTINPQFKDHLYQRTLLSLLRMTWMLLSPARF